MADKRLALKGDLATATATTAAVVPRHGVVPEDKGVLVAEEVPMKETTPEAMPIMELAMMTIMKRATRKVGSLVTMIGKPTMETTTQECESPDVSIGGLGNMSTTRRPATWLLPSTHSRGCPGRRQLGLLRGKRRSMVTLDITLLLKKACSFDDPV